MASKRLTIVLALLVAICFSVSAREKKERAITRTQYTYTIYSNYNEQFDRYLTRDEMHPTAFNSIYGTHSSFTLFYSGDGTLRGSDFRQILDLFILDGNPINDYLSDEFITYKGRVLYSSTTNLTMWYPDVLTKRVECDIKVKKVNKIYVYQFKVEDIMLEISFR